MARTPKVTEAATDGLPAVPERPKRAKRNPDFDIALGARIRTARIAARMSQTALGEAIGISWQQVQKYELGKDRVAVSTLHAMATALGVHPGTFFDETVPVPAGPIPDVKAAFRSADVLGQIRDPVVLRRLLALAKVLAETKEVAGDLPDSTGHGAS